MDSARLCLHSFHRYINIRNIYIYICICQPICQPLVTIYFYLGILTPLDFGISLEGVDSPWPSEIWRTHWWTVWKAKASVPMSCNFSAFGGCLVGFVHPMFRKGITPNKFIVSPFKSFRPNRSVVLCPSEYWSVVALQTVGGSVMERDMQPTPWWWIVKTPRNELWLTMEMLELEFSFVQILWGMFLNHALHRT